MKIAMTISTPIFQVAALGIGDTILLIIVAAIVAAVIVYGILAWTGRVRRIRVPALRLDLEHVGLYFDEHFADIIREWDLITKPRLDAWISDMNSRLDELGKHIDRVKSLRSGIDPRIAKLEERIKVLEGS